MLHTSGFVDDVMFCITGRLAKALQFGCNRVCSKWI